MEKKESIHKGHRERMRERFEKTGFEGWSKVEILEFMLYSVYSQRDTNPIAHRLLDYSNQSFINLLNSSDSFTMCENVKDVGERTVLFLRSLRLFMDYYRSEQMKEQPINLTSSNFAEFLQTIEFSDEREDIVLVCLDKHMRTKALIRLAEDSDEDYAVTRVDRLVRAAVGEGASNVILVHNHPGGYRRVSAEDIHMTIQARNILYPFGIHLVDHFIICGDEAISIVLTMAENMKNGGNEQ